MGIKNTPNQLYILSALFMFIAIFIPFAGYESDFYDGSGFFVNSNLTLSDSPIGKMGYISIVVLIVNVLCYRFPRICKFLNLITFGLMAFLIFSVTFWTFILPGKYESHGEPSYGFLFLILSLASLIWAIRKRSELQKDYQVYQI